MYFFYYHINVLSLYTSNVVFLINTIDAIVRTARIAHIILKKIIGSVIHPPMIIASYLMIVAFHIMP